MERSSWESRLAKSMTCKISSSEGSLEAISTAAQLRCRACMGVAAVAADRFVAEVWTLELDGGASGEATDGCARRDRGDGKR